jgi:hypothetical protein
MRDRLIALSMRRPLVIDEKDSTIPMLQLQDFETRALSPEVLRMLGRDCSAADRSRRTQLATLCIKQLKLYECIGYILSSQYSVQARRHHDWKMQAIVTLVPKRCPLAVAEVSECGRQLDEWYEQLQENGNETLEKAKPKKSQEVLKVHVASLIMIYFAASSALYRPHVVSFPNPCYLPGLPSLSQRKVREAGCGIARISWDLMGQDLIEHLPPSSVTALLPAAFNHSFESASLDESCCNQRSGHFFQCIQVLHRLGERFLVAKQAVSFLLSGVRQAGLNTYALQAAAAHQVFEGLESANASESCFALQTSESALATQSMSTSPSPSDGTRSHGQSSMKGTSPSTANNDLEMSCTDEEEASANSGELWDTIMGLEQALNEGRMSTGVGVPN